MKEPKVNGMKVTSNLPATSEEMAIMPALEVSMEKVEITAHQIRQYVAPPDATAADIAFFMAMSRSLSLNPFAGEIYMIPFKGKGGRKYAGVVAYTVLLDRADASGTLDGIEIEMDDEENPTKCTVIVHRKDWKIPFKRTTLMSESMKMYNDRPQALWATRPRQMLEKCAVTAALRMAIPACRRMPYIGEEVYADPGQYQESQVQLSEARVTSAEVVDIDYLRGQYFKLGKDVWADEDARHKWNVDHGFPESTKGWLPIYWEKAIDILDPIVDSEPAEFYDEKSGRMPLTDQEAAAIEAEQERLNAEVGADGATVSTEDGAEQPSTTEDGSEVEMESADAIQDDLDAKRSAAYMRVITLVQESPLKTVDTNGFITWRNQILPDEKGVGLGDLTIEDLNILIGDLEVREDKAADDAAEANGELDLGGA